MFIMTSGNFDFYMEHLFYKCSFSSFPFYMRETVNNMNCLKFELNQTTVDCTWIYTINRFQGNDNFALDHLTS